MGCSEMLYQIGGQPEEVGDTLVVGGFIATAGLHEDADFGGRGVVLQRCDHQSAGKLANLERGTQSCFFTFTIK